MNKKYIRLFLIIIAVAIAIIGKNLKPPFDVVRKDGEIVSSVPTEDPKMQSIIQNARDTVPEFIKSLNTPAADETNFMVKYPFDTDPGSQSTIEHMWIDNISETNGKYSGTLINTPFEVKSLKYGDTINFDIAKISDWKYEKAGKIIGGKSIKYLIENVPENERSEEEKEYLKLFD